MKKTIFACITAFIMGMSTSYAVYDPPVAVYTPDIDYDVVEYYEGGVSGVNVRFDINEDGDVENVELLSSTGDSVVDAEIVDTIATWQYEPARDGRGNPVETSKTVYIDLDV